MDFRKNSAITLIALVITIIVLLILAAVSLNLVAGGDGILGKATTAVENTNTAKIAEEIELAIAQLKTEYYEARYVERNTEFTSFGAYAEDKLKVENGVGGIETSSGGKITLEGTTISFTDKDGTIATGNFKVDDDGSVTILGIKIEGEAEKTPATFASQIDTANYGDYVDLGTELLPTTDGVITQKLGGAEPTEQPLTDWRIFHEDADGGIYLILADYLPYEHEKNPVLGSSTGLGTGLLNNGTDYPYNWKSGTNRKDLIDRLNDTTTWNKLISSTYAEKGITVTGTLELEKWVESWNAKGYTRLFTKKGSAQSDELEGYYFGTVDRPETTYIIISNGDTLYFPHTKNMSQNIGYWLSSPCAYSPEYVIVVAYDGGMGSDSYKHNHYGVRPAVYIPAGINAEKNAEGIWELDI